ncbi:TPA: hypothetical protein ACF9CH_002877 [Staphylococcus aureus]|nr:hypothetical protein [Staphylococcus aureus]
MGRENKDYFNKNNNKPMSFEDTAKSSNTYENNNEKTTEGSKNESSIAIESNNQDQEVANTTVSEGVVESNSEDDQKQETEKATDNSKKRTEYKGELGNLLNDVEVGHKFTGFNIDNDIVQRLDAFCEGKPRGTKTKLVNLILRNGLDNIESKGKL